LVHSLYAYRIWIGICSPINRFAMAYVVNIVSTGRSRALPIVVVSVQSLLMYYAVHSADAPLGHRCDHKFR
jgi:hypothetical protein